MAEDGKNREDSDPGLSPWRFLPLALVVIAVAAIFATGLHRSLTFEAFIDYQGRLEQMVAAHRLKMLGLYVLVYVGAVTLSLPVSAFLTAIGGYLFGYVVGTGAAAVSATLGATSIFLIARTSLGQPLLNRAGPRIRSLADGFRKRAFSYLLFLRLMPVVPFWLTNLAAAFCGIGLRKFVLATQIGMLPASFAFAFAGSGLEEVIEVQARARAQCLAGGGGACAVDFDVKSLLTTELMIALGVLSVLALAPILYKRLQERRTRGTTGEENVQA
ncbi:TVP38/TMEM64 family protein [Microvirga lenta]|uniref:TVP38/TMEM64 family protein n=1 Tax=Microvirga lenta TaxID=2881337 RepID=UPI001CFDDDCD|nr:TVP38/TMEM64 family protein [Microvirga lenta]MCB5173982.1 TVP38/TMEM64 family protein [Microvirga lenta]